MDGNGRWARNKKLDVSEGHIAGYKKIRPVISYLSSRGVKFVTVYAFSTENWERPEPEVSAIMDLAGAVIKEELEEISKDNISILDKKARLSALQALLKKQQKNVARP